MICGSSLRRQFRAPTKPEAIEILPALSAPAPKAADIAGRDGKTAISGPPVAVERPEEDDEDSAASKEPPAESPAESPDDDKPPATVDAARRQV